MTRTGVGIIVTVRCHHKGHVRLSEMIHVELSMILDNTFHEYSSNGYFQCILSRFQCRMIMYTFLWIPQILFPMIDDITNDGSSG